MGLNNHGLREMIKLWFTDKRMAEMEAGDISEWDTSEVTDMSGLFQGVPGVRDFNDYIGAWDVSKVTDMHEMFHGASAFNRYIGTWKLLFGPVYEIMCGCLLDFCDFACCDGVLCHCCESWMVKWWCSRFTTCHDCRVRSDVSARNYY